MDGGEAVWKFKWKKSRAGKGGRTGGRAVSRMEGRRKTGREHGWIYLKNHTIHPDTSPAVFCSGRY